MPTMPWGHSRSTCSGEATPTHAPAGYCSATAASNGGRPRSTGPRPQPRSRRTYGGTSTRPSGIGHSAPSARPRSRHGSAASNGTSRRPPSASCTRSWPASSGPRYGTGSSSPCVDIRLPKLEPKRVEPLATEKVEALIEAMPSRYRALVVLAAGTGLRQGEAFAVEVEAVDWLRRPLRRTRFSDIWRPAAASAGLGDEVTFHDLRHASTWRRSASATRARWRPSIPTPTSPCAGQPGGRGSRPVSRLLCPGRTSRVAAIHLGPALPPASSGPPGDSAGPASAAASPRPVRPLFDLAPGGVYRADRSPGRWCALTAPFHPCRPASRAAVCSLWHCPAGRPDWRLASTLPCGGRTFLDPGGPGPRPPSRLPLPGQYATRSRPDGGILEAWSRSSPSPSSSSRWPSWRC